MAYLRSAGLLDVYPPSIVFGCSHRRGAMNSQNSPSSASIFLTWAAPRSRLGRRQVGGDDVVIVKLHAVEAELLVSADLLGEGDLCADRGAEGVCAGADVPRAKGEAIIPRSGESHSSLLLKMPISFQSTHAARSSAGLDSSSGRGPESRCGVDQLTIKCASCQRSWHSAVPFSVYEQQAVESNPCPHCGAYTLCCQEPPGKPAPGHNRMDPVLLAGVAS